MQEKNKSIIFFSHYENFTNGVLKILNIKNNKYFDEKTLKNRYIQEFIILTESIVSNNFINKNKIGQKIENKFFNVNLKKKIVTLKFNFILKKFFNYLYRYLEIIFLLITSFSFKKKKYDKFVFVYENFDINENNIHSFSKNFLEVLDGLDFDFNPLTTQIIIKNNINFKHTNMYFVKNIYRSFFKFLKVKDKLKIFFSINRSFLFLIDAIKENNNFIFLPDYINYLITNFLIKNKFLILSMTSVSDFRLQKLDKLNDHNYMYWYSQNIMPLYTSDEFIDNIAFISFKNINSKKNIIFSNEFVDYYNKFNIFKNSSFFKFKYLVNRFIDFKFIDKHANYIVLFDVPPKILTTLHFSQIDEYHSYQNSKKFLKDIVKIITDINSTLKHPIMIYLKSKSKSIYIDERYSNLINLISKKNIYFKVIYEVNIIELIKNSKLTISIPWSSPSIYADNLNIKSAYYDPSGMLLKSNYINNKIHFLKSFESLNNFLFDFMKNLDI